MTNGLPTTIGSRNVGIGSQVLRCKNGAGMRMLKILWNAGCGHRAAAWMMMLFVSK
jgi:hypothetical protein